MSCCIGCGEYSFILKMAGEISDARTSCITVHALAFDLLLKHVNASLEKSL
jgi:hypothetical protein